MLSAFFIVTILNSKNSYETNNNKNIFHIVFVGGGIDTPTFF